MIPPDIYLVIVEVSAAIPSVFSWVLVSKLVLQLWYGIAVEIGSPANKRILPCGFRGGKRSIVGQRYIYMVYLINNFQHRKTHVCCALALQ